MTPVVEEALRQFPVVVLTGARQTGRAFSPSQEEKCMLISPCQKERWLQAACGRATRISGGWKVGWGRARERSKIPLSAPVRFAPVKSNGVVVPPPEVRVAQPAA